MNRKFSIANTRGVWLDKFVIKMIKAVFLERDDDRVQGRERVYQSWNMLKGTKRVDIKEDIKRAVKEYMYEDRFWIALSKDVMKEGRDIDLENEVLKFVVKEVYDGHVRDVLIRLKDAKEYDESMYKRKGERVSNE